MLTFLADIDIDGSIGGSLLFAIICAVIAPGRGRSALAWFFIGLFLSCIGLIILLLIPDLKEQEARERSRGKSVRRLKEQLKKERQVADQRHAAHAERLDAHDRALGIDTRPELTHEETAAIDAPPAFPPPPPDPAERMWFFAANEKQLGPVSESQLKELHRGGQITDDTLVWSEGMADWEPFADTPEL